MPKKAKPSIGLGATLVRARRLPRGRAPKKGAPDNLQDAADRMPQVCAHARKHGSHTQTPAVIDPASKVDESSVEEFMARATLANRDFTADKDSARLIEQNVSVQQQQLIIRNNRTVCAAIACSANIISDGRTRWRTSSAVCTFVTHSTPTAGD
jgi:hypothetical protein